MQTIFKKKSLCAFFRFYFCSVILSFFSLVNEIWERKSDYFALNSLVFNCIVITTHWFSSLNASLHQPLMVRSKGDAQFSSTLEVHSLCYISEIKGIQFTCSLFATYETVIIFMAEKWAGGDSVRQIDKKKMQERERINAT